MKNLLDDRTIDKLVDDELSPTERRELLSLVEADSTAWRKIALAFLEAQTWTSEASRFAVGPAAIPLKELVSPPTRVPIRRRGGALRIAAAILCAFGLGLVCRGGTRQIMIKPELVDRPATDLAVVDPVDESAASDTLEPAPQTVLRLEYSTSESGELTVGEIPLVSADQVDPRWMDEQPPAVSDYVRRQWESRGYQVEERRRLVSVELQDGRQAVVPVGDIRVKYVGQRIN